MKLLAAVALEFLWISWSKFWRNCSEQPLKKIWMIFWENLWEICNEISEDFLKVIQIKSLENHWNKSPRVLCQEKNIDF